MAAERVANVRDAIRDGSFPGGFAADRTCFTLPTLTYTGARGVTLRWTNCVRLVAPQGGYAPITDEMLDRPPPDLPGYKAEISVEALSSLGKVRETTPTHIAAGKNLGRKNATNCVSQAFCEALSLYNKQRKRVLLADAGTADADADTPAAADEDEDEEGAAAESSVFDPRPPPMLVKPFMSCSAARLVGADYASGVTVQRKLNGVRFVVAATVDGPVCYSRTGMPYPDREGIGAEAAAVLAAAPPIPPGAYGTPPGSAEAYGATPAPYLDGELYLHGTSLAAISGQARRGLGAAPLEFHVFDVFFPRAKAAGFDMEYRHRRAYLAAMFAAATAPRVVLVENFAAADRAAVEALARRFLNEGYEGAIARKDSAGYRYGYGGYHSANLVKIKPVFENEFAVTGYTQGTRGKEVGAVIWECEVALADAVDPLDRRFSVVPKDLTYEDRRAIYKRLGELVDGPDGQKCPRFERNVRGRPLTVEYREASAKTGKPLQAKAKAFRTYEGPADDPLKALLRGELP